MKSERLQNKKVHETLTLLTWAIAVPYVVIDEAHCVSEWGHDFRTSYLNFRPWNYPMASSKP